jgi:hypothetical protein
MIMMMGQGEGEGQGQEAGAVGGVLQQIPHPQQPPNQQVNMTLAHFKCWLDLFVLL